MKSRSLKLLIDLAIYSTIAAAVLLLLPEVIKPASKPAPAYYIDTIAIIDTVAIIVSSDTLIEYLTDTTYLP